MKRSWPGYLPPVVALGVTLAFGLVFGLAVAGTVQDGVLATWLLLLRLTGPVILAVVWGATLIMARPHRVAVAAAALAVAGALVLLPAAAGLPLAGSVAAGLVAGAALGARWRLDVALAVLTGLLVSTVILDVVAVPVDRQMALIREQVTPVLEESIPPGADQAERLEAQRRMADWLDDWFAVMSRLYPLSVLLELLVQALTIMSLVWVTVRLWGWELPSWRPPRFGRWRVPFYLVWLLIAGLGLMILRHPVAVTVGLNLALFAAILLAVQGVAVQVWVTGRMFSLLGRIVFWTVMGLFMMPLVLASGVLLGLVDQWLDLRGLERGSDPEGGK